MIRGALHRMGNLQLSRAWEKWQAEAEALKRERFMVKGAINRLMNLHLSRAWEQWQQEAEEMRRQAELIRRGLMRMLKRQQAMAFTRWVEWYEEILAAQDRLKAGLGRWRNQLLSASWNKWRSALKPKEEPKEDATSPEPPTIESPRFALFSYSRYHLTGSHCGSPGKVPQIPVKFYQTSSLADNYGESCSYPSQPFQSPRGEYDKDKQDPVSPGRVTLDSPGRRFKRSDVQGLKGVGVVSLRTKSASENTKSRWQRDPTDATGFSLSPRFRSDPS